MSIKSINFGGIVLGIILGATLPVYAKEIKTLETNSTQIKKFKQVEADITKSTNCRQIISHCEERYKIPSNILAAIAMVESKQKPWIINHNGHSYSFSGKNAMIKFLKNNPLQRTRFAYVGCMQISYHTHRDRFKDQEDFITPYHNINYAAKHLSQLKQRLGSWEKAVCYYNSCHPTQYQRYFKKVIKAYGKIVGIPKSVIFQPLNKKFKLSPSSVSHQSVVFKPKVLLRQK